MDNYYLESCEDNKHETNKLRDKIKKLEELEEEYLNNINENRKEIIRNNSVGIYFNRGASPIKKLDLNEQIDSNYNRRNKMKKKQHKNSINKNLIYNSSDDHLNISVQENENNNENKLIRVEKKIGLNHKK